MVIKHICISCSQSLLRGIKMKNSCTSYLFLSVCKLTNNKLLVHSPQIVYRRTEIDLMLGAAPFARNVSIENITAANGGLSSIAIQTRTVFK